jgi:Ca2+-binding EF-hand superfamily protein
MHQDVLNDKLKRRWLIKKGKQYLLDFSDDELRKLKECFDSLDVDLSGSIGVSELENPLIGLGFADTR